jgi:hypothetical protein
LADEAFTELLKKNNRPVGLNDALRKSAGHSATVHHLRPSQKESARKALGGVRTSGIAS